MTPPCPLRRLLAGLLRTGPQGLHLPGAVLAFAVWLVGALAATAAPLTPDPSFDPQTIRALTAIVESGRQAASTPGVLVGVWVPGRGSFVYPSGVGDGDTGAPIRLDDHVRIASITKSFTATAVLQLVDRGCIRLDSRLSQFVPGIPYGDQITVEELLNMTAGVYDYFDAALTRRYVEDPLLPGFTHERVPEIIRRHPPAFAPGRAAQYDNSNYVLLGLIVERVTGRPIQQVIQTEILDRLGMTHTQFPTTPAMPEPFAHGYYPNADSSHRDVTFSNPEVPWAAGAILSTLGDLRIWAKALATGTLLSPALQARRLQTVRLPGFNYGLGMMEIAGFIGHGGNVLGYQSAVFYLPSRDATLVVLANEDNLNTARAFGIFAGLAFYLFPEQFSSSPREAPAPQP